MLKSSDIISIHAPLNENTRGLIKAEQLELLKDGAVIVNVGRGGIIDEADLANCLHRREIYAGIDVTENEPLKNDSPLLNPSLRDRLLLTPHIAWASIEARQRLIKAVAGNIREYFGL